MSDPRSAAAPRAARRARRAAVALATALTTALAACAGGASDRPPGNPDPTQNTYAPQLGVALQAFNKTQSGVYYLDLDRGEGLVAAPGARVTVHYTGWLPDGTKFDSSKDRNEPFPFTVGAGDVIRGWDDGVQGMRVGGRRKLVIPAELAYGQASPSPTIPANSVLVFEVQLLGVQ